MNQTIRQDLPPKNGYAPINYSRIPAKQYFKGWTMIAGYLGLTAFGFYMYSLTYKEITRGQIEMRSARFAIQPFLLAEKDREYLKQIRRNRDEEAKLMKNVEGWKVGTYYGEPVYKTVTYDDEWIDQFVNEYYVHTSEEAFKEKGLISLWC